MRIACVLDSDFEDSEYAKPVEALGEAGHEVTVIGFEKGARLAGKKGEVSATSDAGIAEVSPEDFDALLVPGGYSPDHLRGDPRFLDFTRHFATADKPIFAICHGPQLLLTAGVVEGRRMTAWKTIQPDLRLGGAEVVDEEVVVDRRLVTSRQPDDIPAFNRAMVGMLEAAAARR